MPRTTFTNENRLSGSVARLHQAQVDRLIVAFDRYFEPFPEAPARPEWSEEIASALSNNIGQLRAIGHNVIFATLALKVLKDEPLLCTYPLVEAIVKLVSQFHGAGPGGPFPGWRPRELDQLLSAPPPAPREWAEPTELARYALKSLTDVEHVCAGAHAGVVGHVLTHADALVELSRLGYTALAHRGRSAYLTHATLVVRGFDPSWRMSVRTPSKFAALTEDYWGQRLKGRSNWSFGHKFKYPYSFYRLCRLVEDAELKRRGAERFLSLL